MNPVGKEIFSSESVWKILKLGATSQSELINSMSEMSGADFNYIIGKCDTYIRQSCTDLLSVDQ
jgi:hypothetical protein